MASYSEIRRESRSKRAVLPSNIWYAEGNSGRLGYSTRPGLIGQVRAGPLIPRPIDSSINHTPSVGARPAFASQNRATLLYESDPTEN